MNNPKIALTAIIKDDSEAKMFENMLESFMPYMSGLYVAVTGVSGHHKEIHKLVKKYGGKSISTYPETHPDIYTKINGKTIFANFAAARNVSWSLVDKDYDYLCWADADDVLLGGDKLLEIAQKSLDRNADAVQFTYWYAVQKDEQGNVIDVIVDQMRERLLKPGKFKWVSRLHEVAVPKDDNFKPYIVGYFYDEQQGHKTVWMHDSDMERIGANLERNRTILEIQYNEEEGKDPRTLFYLAKSHFDVGNEESLAKAEDYLVKYLQSSGWDEERANALEYLALMYGKRKDYRKSVQVYLQALQEYPKHHVVYLRLADAYYTLGMKEFGDHWLGVVMNMPAPTTSSTIGNLFEIKMLTASVNYNKARMENKIDDMVYWAEVRKSLMKGKDDGLYEATMDSKYTGMAVAGVYNFSKWLKDNGFGDRVKEVIKQIPDVLADQPLVQGLINKIQDPKDWPENSIVYFASFGNYHFEPWSAKSLESGIGGSESAVIYLAKEWTKAGYDVTVYCDCGEDAGDYDGVHYVPFTRINWNDNFNILILWRSPHLLDRDIKAKHLYMDLHDVASPLDWSEERWKKVEKIFVKSSYHRDNLPNIPDEKFERISNGI